MPRLVVVASQHSYRTADFVAAAHALQVEPVVASDAPPPLPGDQIQIDLADPAGAAAVIGRHVPDAAAVIAVDDQGVAAAASAAAALGLAANSLEAVAATRDKYRMRCLLDAARVAQPRFAPVAPGHAAPVASALGYPAVIKPVGLSASRGVIRVDDAGAARRAESRIRGILASAGLDPDQSLLAEEYLPGDEIVVEGLLTADAFETLAIIDKPDRMEGPYFEETLLVTPSRHTVAVQEAATALASAGAGALGLRHGPVHAEVRVGADGSVRLVEIAARSIGGLCGRALSFGLLGERLETLIIRSALGMPAFDTSPARPATGVMMLPIPASGTLTAVDGIAEVEARERIDAVTMTIAPGQRITALPEGERYLGFVFAGGPDAGSVEEELRAAARSLTVVVDGEALPALPR